MVTHFKPNGIKFTCTIQENFTVLYMCQSLDSWSINHRFHLICLVMLTNELDLGVFLVVVLNRFHATIFIIPHFV